MPPREDSPVPVTAEMISPVLTLTMRAETATTAFEFLVPMPPRPYLEPKPPPPMLVCLSSRPNWVMVADDDGVDAKELADFGGAGGIGAVAIGEILFGEEFVECGAFNDGILAVFDELFDEHGGDAFADVLVGAEDGGDGGLDGAVVEVHDGDAVLCWRGRLRLGGGLECEQ